MFYKSLWNLCMFIQQFSTCTVPKKVGSLVNFRSLVIFCNFLLMAFISLYSKYFKTKVWAKVHSSDYWYVIRFLVFLKTDFLVLSLLSLFYPNHTKMGKFLKNNKIWTFFERYFITQMITSTNGVLIIMNPKFCGSCSYIFHSNFAEQ